MRQAVITLPDGTSHEFLWDDKYERYVYEKSGKRYAFRLTDDRKVEIRRIITRYGMSPVREKSIFTRDLHCSPQYHFTDFCKDWKKIEIDDFDETVIRIKRHESKLGD